jgi:hypothetical protein
MGFRGAIKKYFNFLCLLLLLFVNSNTTTAQTIAYSREEVYINNPDDLQLVADVAGNHHLLSFSHNEKPEIFIYNAQLELVIKSRMPFVYPDKASLRIIRFENFYYVFIHPRFSQQNLFWKIDKDGNCTDLSLAFQKLVQSQSDNIKLGFLLIPNNNQLWMVYHTELDDPEKSTMVMVQADSLLNMVFAHKVSYDFKMDEEKLQQKVLVFGRYLFVLKTLQSGTSLELMKVNLATGFTIRNNFHSSGYLYSQPFVDFNTADSTVTVSALLTQPGANNYTPKQFVFFTRLNKILVEQVPFILLKTQFRKNTYTNFLQVEGLSKWVSFKKWRAQSSAISYDNQMSATQDVTMSGSGNQELDYMNNLVSRSSPSRNIVYTDEMGIRFSLLDKDLKIASDSLIPNTKDSYTVIPDHYTRFEINNKEYLLVTQQFFRRKKGLLLVNSNEAHKLVYTYVRVNERYNYLLTKSRVIPKQGILVPYLYKREAGLIKIKVE